jgi:hypothetical protein
MFVYHLDKLLPDLDTVELIYEYKRVWLENDPPTRVVHLDVVFQ